MSSISALDKALKSNYSLTRHEPDPEGSGCIRCGKTFAEIVADSSGAVCKPQNAMVGLADGRKKNRPQAICTPHYIADVVHTVWPEGIRLDPCGHMDSILEAERQFLLEQGHNGLNNGWPERTFINPPYDELKKWLAHGQEQQGRSQIWLVPNRTHRAWFREWRATQHVVVELDPVTFLGYDAPAPFPLVLTYQGVSRDQFVYAAEGLGTIWVRPKTNSAARGGTAIRGRTWQQL